MITVLRSPACNILHFNDLLLRLQKAGEGVRGGSKLANTPALAYADDIVLIDRKVAGLQSKLDIVRLWSEDWGMTEALQEANSASASASASACHQRIESTMVAQRGTDRANIMDLMGFSDDEVAALQGGASNWDFDEDVEDEEDNSQEVAEVEHEAGYSEELSGYDLSPLFDD